MLINAASGRVVAFCGSAWKEVLEGVGEAFVDVVLEQNCDEDRRECRQELERLEFGLKTDGLEVN